MNRRRSGVLSALTRDARAALALAVAVLAAVPAGASAAESLESCATPAAPVVIGAVTCVRVDSAALGGATAFGYYVPPRCAPQHERRCPIVLLLHGGGGTRSSLLGTADDPAPLVRAVDHAPRVDPAVDPAAAEDPADWAPAATLDVVLVAPEGRTLAGGRGPGAGADGAWVDWNPRYARGGDAEAYPTAAPEFEAHVMDEVMPLAQTLLGAGGSRERSAVLGCSLGGYGASVLALRHPDRFARVVAISAVGDPRLLAYPPRVRPQAETDDGFGQVRGGSSPLPAVAGATAGPVSGLDVPFSTYVAAAAYAFGDPAVDAVAFASHAPGAIATNARATAADGEQLLRIVRTVSDGLPLRPGAPGAATIAEQVAVAQTPVNSGYLDTAGVAYELRSLRGLHCRIAPYARALLEAATPTDRIPRAPERFDYVSDRPAFAVWGWRVSVERQGPGVVRLWDVTCRSLVVEGRGRVVIEPPARCRGARSRLTVELPAPAGRHAVRVVQTGAPVPPPPASAPDGPAPSVPPRCRSRRVITATLPRLRRGDRYVSVRVQSGRRAPVATRVDRARRIRIDLRGRPGGEVRVRITAWTASRRTIALRRTFRTCTRKR